VPEVFLSWLREPAGRSRPTLAFRRYLPHEPGYVVPAAEADFAALYSSGGFSEIVLSLTAGPEHGQDWGFLERCAADIIVITGGRSAAGVLEAWHLRVLAKQSSVTSLYRRLRRKIGALCKKGMRHRDTGTQYPDLFWHSPAAPFELRRSLADAHSVYVGA
jgi:hypothetical protein